LAHRVKFTKAVLERLDVDKDGQWVTDTEVPELLVRLSNTSKRFVARWTSRKDGKRKQVTIAPVGTISVDEARDRVRKLVAQDGQTNADTLADVYSIWDSAYSSKVSEGHAAEFRRSYAKHIAPALGKTKLSRLTPRTIQKWYDSKRADNSAATVNRWLAYISKLCYVARVNGFMVGNPVEGIEKSTPNRRLDVFTRDDVKEFADTLIANKDRFPIGVALLRFLMIYPCRGKEAREMQWSDLDLKAGTWTIPADRYKTKRDKVFPLGPLQIEHLDSLPRDSDYVFPMVTDKTRPCAKSHQRHVWETLRPKPLGAHALRRTIGTSLLNKDVPLEVVSKLLGHSSTAVTQAVYAHLEPQTASKYLDKWSAVLEDDETRADDPETTELLKVQAAIAVQRQGPR